MQQLILQKILLKYNHKFRQIVLKLLCLLIQQVQLSGTGSAQIDPYEIVGPTFQTAGLGWGTATWGSSTWGTASATSDVLLDPGLWSLDNFGQILVATIHNGKTFTWNAGAATPRANEQPLCLVLLLKQD